MHSYQYIATMHVASSSLAAAGIADDIPLFYAAWHCVLGQSILAHTYNIILFHALHVYILHMQ